MRALKALVTIMAVIIVLGVAAVIWGVVREVNKMAEAPETSPPLTGAQVVADERSAWDTLTLDQPSGTRIATVTSAGDLVILHVFTETPGREERLLVVDPNSGVLLGTVLLGPKR